MERIDLDNWTYSFEAFHSRFSSLIGRIEVQEQGAIYLQVLLSQVERKNGWQLAEAVGDKSPVGTQRLLYNAQWDVDAAPHSLSKPHDSTYFLSYAPPDTALLTPARVARRAIPLKSVSKRPKANPEKGGSESCLAEVRMPEIGDLLEIALPLPPRTLQLRLAWSH